MRIFSSMGQDLPIPTRILIATSQGLRQWWFWIVIVLIIAALIIKREMGTKRGKQYFSLLKLRFPILGNLILKSEIARFNRTL